MQSQRRRPEASGTKNRGHVNIAVNGAIEPSSLAGHGMPCPY
ncbi:MAG: hypothetical protein WCC03_17120 [Candidatus Acidiferrales bacterium]